MEAKSWVMPCSTYHIKLVVADGGDGVYDSGVFLEEGGIRCASASISVNTATLGNTFYMVEGCTDAVLYFERQGNLSTPYTVKYSIAGSAVNGTDYASIADSVVFGVGQDSVGIVLSAPDDGLNEGVENIFIILVDSLCGAQYSDTARLNIVDPPLADFSMTTACPGFPVQFSDSSVFFGSITGWEWDFGDGSNSTLQNPSHVYSQPGTYTVELKVTTLGGCVDSTSETVTLYELPTAGFTASDFCAGERTVFTDASQAGQGGQVASWTWDFDDGSGSTQHSPWHTFASAGTYNVELIVSNINGCRDTLVQSIVIYDAPLPDFSFSDACHQEVVTFTDQSTIGTGAITTWSWSMGDGSTQNGPVVNHAFSNVGSYPVKLVTVSD